MREQPAGRMLSLTGWMLAALLAATGCQSASPLAKSLSRDPNAATLPAVTSPNPTAGKSDIAWKKASPVPSSAMSQENWNRQDTPIRTTAFKDPPAPSAESMPPIPSLLLKAEAPLPRVVQAQPASFKHLGKHLGASPAPPMIMPSAPNEWSPVTLPSYVVRPPDVLLIELLPQFSRDENLKLKTNNIGLLNQPIYGQHLVRPDGTVELGVYGPVLVSGRTVQEAREEVARVIHARLDPKKATIEDVVNNLKVDVLTYNSSVYYVITDGAGLGQQVYRFPVTGQETVLDAISNINGLPVVSSPRRIWVARKNPGHPGPDNILPVDWKGISEMGVTNTNWQIMPGDRVFVQADPVRRFNNTLGKFLEPIERVLGATLLGGQTVNTIKNGTTVVR
jgi:polysaccharide export outer membrane protein